MTGDGNVTWLLPGRVPTLIDAGTGDPRHLAALEHALAGQALAQVLVTHGHTDHASGAPAIAGLFPDAALRKMPWPERDSRWPVGWGPLGDGDVVEAGDGALRVVHTPGHAPDHVCLWHEPTRTLFSGDLAIEGTTVYIPSGSGDLSDYLASLDRARMLMPRRMLPAHGPVIEDPDALLRAYVEHRLERERQILEALGAHGPATPEDLVARIYADLAEALRPVARDSVLAHLIKLEREARARREDGAWLIMGP